MTFALEQLRRGVS